MKLGSQSNLEAIVILAIVLTVLSLPIFPDPYYHKEKVNFWVWLIREIDELIHGEKE